MGDLVREIRSAALVDAEVKGRRIRGYAAVYDTPWNDTLVQLAGYVEKVARGAFRKALARSDNVPLLWQHERRDVLATTKGGTLRLKEDGKGLAIEADLPDTQLGRDMAEMVGRGDVQGMSYGIAALSSDSRMDHSTKPPIRYVNNAQRLLDVTLTYEPAYEATTVELRNAGFVVIPLQELTVGLEEQNGDAAREFSSLEATHFIARRRALEQSILEKGGILP